VSGSEAIGLESGTVRVVDYDPRWPVLYAAEARRLAEATAGLGLVFEHVGSTSIPGMCAKPIIDIAAGYDDPARLPEYIAAISAAGYTHRGEQGVPGREFFRRGDPRAWHVHLSWRQSREWRGKLRFRDRLRAEPGLHAEYAALKRRLAAQYPFDRESYISAKDPFIRSVLQEGGP